MISRRKRRTGHPLARTRRAETFSGRVETCESRTLLTTMYGLTTSNSLVQFDSATPASTMTLPVTNLGASETLVGIDVRPADGLIYGLTTDAANAGHLYTIDLGTGAATLKSTLAADAADLTNPYTALAGITFGVDFNPVANRLRVVSDTGQDLRINVDTGATTTDADLNPGTPGVTGAGYTNSFAGATTTQLFDIDPTTDQLLLQNPPNNGTLTVVGALGVDATGGDLDIVASGDRAAATNSAFAALTVGGTTSLYSINLTTGAATVVGPIGAGTTPIVGLAATIPAGATTPAANAFALDGSGNLIRFLTSTPGTIAATTPITGLGAGESLLGIDVRPATGDLYALSSLGKVYTINTATGAVTLKSTLAADPTDTTSPFTALAGTNFGVDFNPVPDRLRVVSDTGQDLRINVDTGATTTDADLNPGTPGVTGVGYTNSVPGATTTMLYDIDPTTDQLLLQNPPNNGTLTVVGALGVDATGASDLDIRPGTNSAFATLTVGGTTGLYSINLTTGAATLIGNFTGAVKGLAIAPGGTSASLTGTTATFTGDAGAQTYLFDAMGGLIRNNRFSAGDPGFNSDFDFDPTVAGDQTLSATDPNVKIIVNAGAGNDRLIIGNAGTAASAIAASFTFDGGDGTDTLTLDDSAGATSRTVTAAGGSIAGIGGGITPSNIEAVNYFFGTGTADVLAINANGNPATPGVNGVVTVNGRTITTTGAETVNITNAGGVPLVVATPSPNLSATAGVPLVGATYALFTDADPGAKVGDYTATIDFGDGTTGPGTVTANAASPSGFLVTATHTYSTSGTDAVKVTITDNGGSSTSTSGTSTTTITYSPETPVMATAGVVVSPRATPAIAGRLDATSDTGASATDGVTSVKAPIFSGTATPGTSVVLTLQAVDTSGNPLAASFQVGPVTTDSAGNWSITAPSLGDGHYKASATASQAGSATATVDLGTVTVDTMAPIVYAFRVNPRSGQIVFRMADGFSGLDPAAVRSAANYVIRKLSGASVAITGSSIQSDQFTSLVTLTLDRGRQIKNARFLIDLVSGGIRDLAGNGLDGEFSGSFPTGNGTPGGDFLARLDVANGRRSDPVPVSSVAQPLNLVATSFVRRPTGLNAGNVFVLADATAKPRKVR